MLTLNSDILATNGLGSIISGNLFLGAAKRQFHITTGYGINVQAQISDNGPSVGFDLDGGGTLTLSGSNTFFGPINVKAGVLYARNDNALGQITGGTTIANGARLAIDGRNLGAEPITLSGEGGNGYGAISCAKTNTCTGLVTVASDAVINVVSPTDRLIFGGPLNGPKGITKIGPGTLEFTGNQANTYAGATTVSEGALELTKSYQIAVPGALTVGDNLSPAGSHMVRILYAGQLATNAPVTINSSGALDLSGAFFAPQTIGSLSGSGPVRLGVSPLVTGGDNTDGQFNGKFTGTGSLTKQGSGTWTLGGMSDQFFGVTTVNGGTLSVQNWIPSSPITVNAGAKLMGAGLVGNISSAGGMVSPGCCPTEMKLATKNIALDAASIFRVHLDGLNSGAIVNSSQAGVSGTVNLGGAKLLVSLGFSSGVSNKFTVIDNDGNDPVAGAFQGMPEGAIFVAGGAQFQITYHGGDGNDVVFTQLSPITGAQLSGAQTLPDGNIHINGAGFPNTLYNVEATPNLTPPSVWTNIGSATANALGQMQFTDSNATNYPIRFYRFVLP